MGLMRQWVRERAKSLSDTSFKPNTVELSAELKKAIGDGNMTRDEAEAIVSAPPKPTAMNWETYVSISSAELKPATKNGQPLKLATL